MSDAIDHPEIDPAEFRRVLGHFPTGVTVVTAASPSGPVGVAIGSFASISLDPPLVGFFLGNQSGSGAGIREAGHFCVNVVTPDQHALVGVMASKAEDKFDGVEIEVAPGSGAPVLPGNHALIDCTLEQVVGVGDHDLFVGRVQHLFADPEGLTVPMVFHKGQYGTFG